MGDTEFRDIDSHPADDLWDAATSLQSSIFTVLGIGEYIGREAMGERERLKQLPHDILVDRAYELIEQNGTCDNGGWAYWIDREGFHTVELHEA